MFDKFIKNEKGGSIAEFGLLGGLIAVTSVSVVIGVGDEVRTVFRNAADRVAHGREVALENAAKNNGSGGDEVEEGGAGGIGSSPMILTFAATDGVVTLPLYGAVDAEIDWGGPHSGCTTYINSVGDLTCTYDSPGTYQVKIKGLLDHYGKDWEAAPNVAKLVSVDDWGNTGLTSLASAFFGATNLTSLPSNLPETVTDLSYMLAYSDSNPTMTGWDTSNVNTIEGAFLWAGSFNQPIGSWDITGVNNLEGVFNGAESFNQSLSGWDTSNVVYLRDTFRSAISFNQDLSAWNTSSVIDMYGTFADASVFNGSVTSWDTSNVLYFGEMFKGSAFNKDIGGWSTGTGENFNGMFSENGVFNQNIGGWDVSGATSMFYMFYQATAFDQDISGWCFIADTSEPEGFASGAPIDGTSKMPTWMACS